MRLEMMTILMLYVILDEVPCIVWERIGPGPRSQGKQLFLIPAYPRVICVPN